MGGDSHFMRLFQNDGQYYHLELYQLMQIRFVIDSIHPYP